MSQLITLEGDQTEIGNFQVLEVYGDFLNQEIQGNFVEGNFYAEKALVAPKDSLNGENSYWMSLSGDDSEMGWAAMAKAFSKFGKGFGKGLKIKVPKIKAPKMPKMPKIKIKAPKMPKMPKMPKIKMPKMPKIKMPKMPKIKMPKFKMPEMPEDQTEEDQTEEDQTEEDQTEENQTEEDQTEEDQTEEDQTDEETQTEEDQTDMNDETQLNGNIYNRVNNEMGFLPMLMAAAAPFASTAMDMAKKNQQARQIKRSQNSKNAMSLVKKLIAKPKAVKTQVAKKPVALKFSSSGKMSLSPQVKQTQTPQARGFFEKEKSFYETPQGMAILGGGAIAIFYFMNKKGKRR